MKFKKRRVWLICSWAVLGALILASCSSSSAESSTELATEAQLADESPQETTELPKSTEGASFNDSRGRQPLEGSSARQEVPSGLADRFWDGFSPLVDPNDIVGGGPQPEGIYTLDNPRYDVASEAADDWDDEAPVISINVNGEKRAYPVGIMSLHEIVNDTLGGIPVTVTY